MRVFLHEELEAEEAKRMRRYLVAYDADVVDTAGEATHVLRSDGDFSPDWVMRCVRSGRREPL